MFTILFHAIFLQTAVDNVKQQLTDATTNMQSNGMTNVRRNDDLLTLIWSCLSVIANYHFYDLLYIFWQIAQSVVNDTVNIIDIYFKDVKGKVSDCTCLQALHIFTKLTINRHECKTCNPTIFLEHYMIY